MSDLRDSIRRLQSHLGAVLDEATVDEDLDEGVRGEIISLLESGDEALTEARKLCQDSD